MNIISSFKMSHRLFIISYIKLNAMIVAQINEVCGYGSTGTICQEISEISIDNGINNYVFYGQKKGSYKYSHKFGLRWLNLIHSLLFTRILGIHGFGSILNTLGFVWTLKRLKPDIIHLHSLHTNYINYPILYHFIANSKIPTVMTLHDCYNFTGQCEHYVGVGCNKFQHNCGNCPFIHKTIAPSLFFDWSEWLLSKKKGWYKKIDSLTIVAVSKWLQSEANKSILAINGHNITYIYNWIDTNVFYPRSYEEIELIREYYSLSKKYKYILSVAANWNCNTSKYKDIISLNEMLPQDYKLIVVGGSNKDTKFPESIIRIDYTNNIDDLACLYSLSEAYVHVSVCDTFGKVIAEAMACGTTPIVYNSTACAEVTGGFGVIVEPNDVKAIAKALQSLPHDSDTMIEFVKENYNPQKNIAKYIKLYKSLYNKNDSHCK